MESTLRWRPWTWATMLWLAARRAPSAPSVRAARADTAKRGLDNLEVADLYERFGHLVLRRCRVVLRDESLAEDAFQNTFIKIMRHGGAIREASAPLGFLYRTADRCCFDLLGKRSRQAESPLSEPLVASRHPDPAFEARDTVMALLGKFKQRDREIAVRFFLDGLSQGEIGADLGLSRVTINKRVQAIRARAERFRASGRGL